MDTNEANTNTRESLFFPWAFIVKALAQGALSYIGGQALKSVMGAPVYDDIPALIRVAVEELKDFIREELRKALEETVIIKLQADAKAVQIDLKRYAEVPDKLKREYRYLLEQSDTNTSSGMTLSESYGLSALPIYVSFISLRILVIRAFYELDHSKTNLRNFAKELQKIETGVNSLLENYYVSGLDPQRRLSAIYCGVRCSDGDFPIEYTWCCSNQDGKPDDGICAGSAASSEDVIRPIAEGKRAQRANELEAERGKINDGYIKPIKEVTTTWNSIIKKLERI